MPAIGSVAPRLHRGGGSIIIDTDGQWVGSKAAKRTDLVTLDSNGRYDQVVAVSTAINSSSSRFGAISQPVKSTAAQGTKVSVDKFDDDVLIALPCATSAGVAKATALAMKGKLYPLYRDANGNTTVNTDSNTNPVVEVVDIDPNWPTGEVGGFLLCRVLQSMRLS